MIKAIVDTIYLLSWLIEAVLILQPVCWIGLRAPTWLATLIARYAIWRLDHHRRILRSRGLHTMKMEREWAKTDRSRWSLS